MRWTKFDDESTSFFHAVSTERYRINTITSLDLEDGRTVTEHQEKASALWEEYRDRMSQTCNPTMWYNLQEMIQQQDLQHLSSTVTKEEIDDIIKQMPTDKAPGPDGFNGLFLKKCWNIIKEDIYKLCFDFFQGNIDLTAINNSFITLIPKTNSPTHINDYRPISLINCVIKIITKIMGNRLQASIIPLLHKNQYGFIKTRTIQDCLAWAFEYIHQCKQTKQELIILKLDFMKAFDTVEHNAIMLMLQQMGFSDTWLRWTQSLLSTASTSILLNGVPGKQLHQKRGVGKETPSHPSFLS